MYKNNREWTDKTLPHMKKILLFSYMLMVIGIGSGSETLAAHTAPQPAVSITDSIQLVPSAYDSTRMDTIVFSQLETDDDVQSAAAYPSHLYSSNSLQENENSPRYLLELLLILTCVGLPFFILAMVLWFRYKNRQAKYKLAAEALAAGHPIPAELLNTPEKQHQTILTKGIKNCCLGIGLGVFFWMSVEEEGVAAIGFLIFCMGVGQILIAYATRPRHSHQEENVSKQGPTTGTERKDNSHGQATPSESTPSDPNIPHA